MTPVQMVLAIMSLNKNSGGTRRYMYVCRSTTQRVDTCWKANAEKRRDINYPKQTINFLSM